MFLAVFQCFSSCFSRVVVFVLAPVEPCEEKEALEGAKELYELARVKEGARRCELRLRELKLQGETKAEAGHGGFHGFGPSFQAFLRSWAGFISKSY